jgi:hypothetical protein
MVVSGVISMGAGTVVACKKTLGVEEVLAKHTPDLEKIKKGESLEVAEYGKEAAQNDRIKVYTRAAFDLGKLYFVPIVLFGSGVGLVLGGHRILLRRNATLAIAFTSLKRVFDRYRQNVVEEFGSDADQAMYSGHIVKEVYDDESGQTQLINTRDWDAENDDPYNRIFEQGATREWQNDLGINKMFVHNQQRYANELLMRRGFLYLSDVYKSLGFPESDISRVVGWKVRHLPDGSKDIPIVDYGLDKSHPDDWKYSREKAIYLDFNCQGLIVGGKVQKILERA